MSLTSIVFRHWAAKYDAKRDAGLTTPDDITRIDNLCYGENEKWNALDVYYPKNTNKPLPVIVSIHGGGYVYGTKEVYQYYCMSLAQHGFSVINFNYHLAPKSKFPNQLREINQVFEWMCENTGKYYFDLNNVFIVGDSAGAQLNSQYSLMWADPDYASLFKIKIPDFRIAAIGLNCGMYDNLAKRPRDGMFKGIIKDYLGKNPDQYVDLLEVKGRIKSNYPPSYVMTSVHDFLKYACQPMAEHLISKGVPVEWKIYGEESDKMAAHVFHCNIRYDLAIQCNNDQIAFFRKYIT